MASLLVRGIEETLVQSLREQAAAHGRSAEAEHRHILANALRRPIKLSFAQALSNMPDVGDDEDFERADDSAEATRVFD